MAAERAISAYRFGKFLLDVVDHVLWCHQQRVALTPKEFDTLHVLVARAGHVVGREELLQAVWPDSFVSDSNLTRNISVLRKHLGAAAIKTIPKRGYCFALAVEPSRELSTQPRITRPRVAVLPFANLSGDESLDSWVDTVCEETIAALVRNLQGSLPVVSLATLAQYQQAGKSAQEIAEDLRVEYLFTAWARSEAGALRFHVEVVNARSFTFVWVGSLRVQRQDDAMDAAAIGARIAQEAKAILLPGVAMARNTSVAAEAGQD